MKIPAIDQATGTKADDLATHLIDEITEVLLAKLAGCATLKKLNPKPWWCPHLSQLRDNKKVLVAYMDLKWQTT